MRTLIGTVQASVNGSEFYPATVRFDQNVERILSSDSVKPDPAWEHADSNGHFHAFAAEGKTPTLKAYEVHVDCDGSCGGICEGEGYTQTHWKCVICGEEVEPRFVPDLEAATVGVPVVTSRWATVTVRGAGPLPEIGQRDNGDGTQTLTFGGTPARATLRVRALGNDEAPRFGVIAGDGEMVGTGFVGPLSFSGGGGWEMAIEHATLLPRLGAMQRA